ncbi:ctr copper transporter [Coniella lustricola]|uniref:Copper transport protein n=1 Tax=Coniella lustricola TaxID=2025994 RepID=A0A2T3AI11_9PEZI|nr:ctr copper transporter [Coniella lustricola]
MDMTSSMTTCNQSMLWNWYTIDSCFIAESWHIGSNGAFAATCIGTILLVMVMEALRRLGKEYDNWILQRFQACAGSNNSFYPSATSSAPNKGFAKGAAGISVTATGASQQTQAVIFRASLPQQMIRAIIHAVALGVAYLVMLLVMSYNGYVIICVIIGAALGKFFCDWMTMRIIVKIDGTVNGAEESAAGIEEPSVCCG